MVDLLLPRVGHVAGWQQVAALRMPAKSERAGVSAKGGQRKAARAASAGAFALAQQGRDRRTRDTSER